MAVRLGAFVLSKASPFIRTAGLAALRNIGKITSKIGNVAKTYIWEPVKDVANRYVWEPVKELVREAVHEAPEYLRKAA